MRINELKGIGDKTEKLFNKLNVYTTEDLIHFYPRTYDVYEELIRRHMPYGERLYHHVSLQMPDVTEFYPYILRMMTVRVSN